MTDIQEISEKINYGKINLLPDDIKTKGVEMSEVYLYLYCIENSLRIFIEQIIQSEMITIPKKVKITIDKMRISEQQNKYLPIRGNNDLFYCDFIQLGQIIISNWTVFKKYFPNEDEHWVNVNINELYKIRCLVAHNSFVSQNERNALKVYYNNIISQIKLTQN